MAPSGIRGFSWGLNGRFFLKTHDGLLVAVEGAGAKNLSSTHPGQGEGVWQDIRVRRGEVFNRPSQLRPRFTAAGHAMVSRRQFHFI